MLALWMSVCFLLYFEIGHVSSTCPCSDSTLCGPIKGKSNKKELVGFSLGMPWSGYQQFDWSKLTTLVLTSGHIGNRATDEIVCLAHKNNVKVQLLVGFKTSQLVSPNFREKFIKTTLEKVKKYNLDGVNMDYEDPLTPRASSIFTGLMRHLRDALKKANPNYSLSLDYVYCAFCSPRRTFNIRTIKKYIDFFILMDYDLQMVPTFYHDYQKNLCWQVFNAPLPAIIRGMKSFIQAGIPRSQLVLAFPWYGNVYKCERVTNNVCYVDCANVWKGGHQRLYRAVINKLHSGPYQRMWNSRVSMPFFTFKSQDGSTYQMNYDDVQSLQMKYNVVKKYNLRGVGIWAIDYLDYGSKNETIVRDRQQMWGILPGGY